MKLNIRNIAGVVILLILLNTVQIYTLYITRKYGDIDFFKFSTHLFHFVNALLSIASTLIAWKLLKKFARKQRSVLTFFISFLLFSVFTTLYFVLNRTFYGHTTSINLLVGNIVTSFIFIHVFISAYTVAYLYFIHSRDLELAVEKLENEKIKLNSSLLKQNLEPHFLFNNLSVLQGLARNSPERTEDFIENFSDVYRYYLKHNSENFVPLSHELRFVEQYMELMKTRFGRAYQCEISVGNMHGFVLPCAIQLCVENAIKHNMASEDNSLHIHISLVADNIVVANEIKKIDFTKSSGLGNKYLKRRYELIFGKTVTTEIIGNQYVVKIPIIQE